MTQQLAPLPVEWSFFDAHRRLPTNLPYDEGGSRWMRGRVLTPGELGCFASHYAIWKELAEAPEDQWVCVLEDDVIIDPLFFQDLAAIVRSLGAAEYVRLYAKAPVPFKVLPGRYAGRFLIRFCGGAFGTQGYLLRAAGARKLLASVTRVVRPVDDEMDRFWSNGLPSLCFYPFPIIESAEFSTIENERRVPPNLTRIERLKRVAYRASEKTRRGFANEVNFRRLPNYDAG